MKKLLILVLLFIGCFYPMDTIAQAENNIWAFGDSLGLDFTAGEPVPIKTSIYSLEDCGTVCDANGELLFYCGRRLSGGSGYVFDRLHNVMPNGFGMKGNIYTSAYQGVRIFPFLDGSKRYHLFIQSAVEDLWMDKMSYLYYSIIDMSLNGGLGDVDPMNKNIIIDSFTSESMTGAAGTDCSVWLIVNRCDTSCFHAFRIDAAGLNRTPVVSGFPSIRKFITITSDFNPFMHAPMNISPGNNLLVRSKLNSPVAIELFDFDNSTGMISNRRLLDSAVGGWPQFSPDGTKLYLSSPLRQYDLSYLPSIAAVKASKYIVKDSVYGSAMRTGEDGKIYMHANVGSKAVKSLYRFNFPNLAGAACDFKFFLEYPKTLYGAYGFGQPITLPIPMDTSYERSDAELCFLPSATLSARPGYSSYLWADGKKGRTQTFSAPGKTWVTMSNLCKIIIDTFYITATKTDSFFTRKDLDVCFVRPYVLTLPDFSRSFRWNDGDTAKMKTIAGPGKYWVQYYGDGCSVHQDTFYISAAKFDSSFRTKDTFVCTMKPFTIDLYGETGADAYLWNDGTKDESIKVNLPGTFWVNATKDCSVKSDTFFIKTKSSDTLFSRRDTSVCFTNEVEVIAAPGFAHYLWSDGATTAENIFNKTETKWVAADNEDCSVQMDTIGVNFINYKINLPFSDSLCVNEAIVLDAGTENASYLWSTGDTSAKISVSEKGNYTVEVKVGPCSLTHRVNVHQTEFEVTLGPDKSVCEGTEVNLQADLFNASFRWSDNSQARELRVSQAGTYWVEATKNKCTASDTIRIETVNCEHCLVSPNAFTPNNDGRNDVYKAIFTCPVRKYLLKVFNRFGQEVFSTENANAAWDGTFKGKELGVDVYFYLIKVTFDIPDAKEELYKGDITLIR